MFTLHMESLAFMAVAALLLVGLHLVVAAYLYRVALAGEASAFDAGTAPKEQTETPTEEWLEEGDETMRCPTCGAPNDPSYRFCRRCVADLTSQHRTADETAAGRLGS